MLMAENGERIALVSAEGGAFGHMLGRYHQTGGPNLDIYLAGHTGDHFSADRATRDPVVMNMPALSMCLMVQPAALDDLGRTPILDYRGLLARFLYAMPPSLVGSRLFSDSAISAEGQVP